MDLIRRDVISRRNPGCGLQYFERPRRVVQLALDLGARPDPLGRWLESSGLGAGLRGCASIVGTSLDTPRRGLTAEPAAPSVVAAW